MTWLPDKELQSAFDDFAHRMQPVPAMPQPDAHGLIQEFGQEGFPLEAPQTATLVVTKQCQLVEWSLDVTPSGTAEIQLQWSPWKLPRAWADMIGTGVHPSVSGVNSSSADLSSWAGPLYLRRKDAIKITVSSASGIEQLTFVMYMRELPKLAVNPS